MITTDNTNGNTYSYNICIVLIWCTCIYSSIIQHIYPIPYGMLLLGTAILFFYALSNSGKAFIFREMITEEDIRMLWFMVYMLISGVIFASHKNNHLSQWITCLEYLFIQMVIASIIKCSGTDNFYILLLTESIILAYLLILNPVNYAGSGRYSISNDVNPNGLGMAFVLGIWAILYRQQKKKQLPIISGAFVVLFGYCILLTGSRKSLIGAGLTIFFWLFFCFLPSLNEKRFINGLFSFILLIILLVIIMQGFIRVYGNTSSAARMDDLLNEATEGNRSNMYRDGFNLIKMNPLFGFGFGGFQHYFGSYSHATLVEIPVSGGIIGALLYFSIYYISLRKIIWIYFHTKKNKRLFMEHMKIKMLFILWILMMFYTICIIHPYQFDSAIVFGLIFGETAYLESGISGNIKQEASALRKTGCKYIK